MLNNNMVSPKSYEFKKIELKQNLEMEKNKTLEKFK